MTRTVLACYDGTCPVCSGPIAAGVDRIYFTRRGRTSYVEHESCDDARRARELREREARLSARYCVVSGPLPERPTDVERVAGWGYLPAHGCYGTLVERWDGHLVIGDATFLGYRWRACVDLESEAPEGR